MNISTLDLNLLRVFDAVLRRGSGSAAALELNLSQPAVSSALRRLRDALGDDLFVRTRRGMQPTAFARAIAEPVSSALRSVEVALLSGAAFDPARTRRRFRLLMTDAGEVVFLPQLIPLLRREAPSLDLEVAQLPIDRYLQALETDEVDLAIGNLRARSGSLVIRRLFAESYVALCRAHHPWVRRAPSLATYLSAEHVVVAPPSSPSGAIEALAQREGWPRRIALSLPHFMVLASIIEATDLVATVPTRVAAALGRRHPVAAVRLPFESPRITISIGWHMRQQKDSGSKWLRDTIIRLMTEGDPRAPEGDGAASSA